MGRGRRALLGSDLDSSESDGSEDDASDAEDAELRAAVLANARASAAAPSLNAPGGDLSDGDATRGVPRSATAEVDEEERAILCGDVDDVLNGASMTAARGDTTDAAASTAAGAASNAHAHTAGGIHRRAPRVVTGINAGRIGPELERLREAQEREHGAREYYTEEHYDRLYGRRRPWGRDGRGGKVWCKDVHGQGCTECTSCHFCRQKTADVKTTCQCARWKKTPPGGRGRGAWCGWCLEMRMGENIEEALADDEWRCPVCRDICNCSGANCLRAKRGLFPTQQLTHEAHEHGWQSVAHYLITTRIVTGKEDAPPILDLPLAQREQFRRRRRALGLEGAGDDDDDANTAVRMGARVGSREHERREREGRKSRASALRARVASRLSRVLALGLTGEIRSDPVGPENDRDASGDPPEGSAAAPPAAAGPTTRATPVLLDDDDSSGSDLDSSDGEEDYETEVEVEEDGAPGVGAEEGMNPSRAPAAIDLTDTPPGSPTRRRPRVHDSSTRHARR